MSTSNHPQHKIAAIGMFDGVHCGHAWLIRQLQDAARLRGLASAVVTFSAHPKQVLGGVDVGMIMSRRRCVETLHKIGVDDVILLDFSRQLASLTSREFMRLLRSEYGITALLIGFNHKFGSDRQSSFSDYTRYGAEEGVEVILVEEYTGDAEGEHISSSLIRHHLSEGEVAAATRCLGRPFSLDGIVVHGYKNGRTIGFPTANVGQIDANVVRPRRGVYVVSVDVEGYDKMWGMANVGYRPTVDANNTTLSVEVNIFNFDDDIYDRHIEVEFLHYLRDEVNMGSLEGLKRQLQLDRTRSLEIIDACQF